MNPQEPLAPTVEELVEAFEAFKRIQGIHSALHDLPECKFRTALVAKTVAILDSSPSWRKQDRNAPSRSNGGNESFMLKMLQSEVQGCRLMIASLERELADSREVHARFVEQSKPFWRRKSKRGVVTESVLVSGTDMAGTL